ncbi:hypothetical protein PMI08_03158 [Brevibacillus sp. CF112]|nr:hypothetical protein PMI08_03158 [Brevibacillus sp. CF112]
MVGDKFLGLGLKRIVGLWAVIILLTVIAKVVFTKHHVKGVSEIIQAA